MQPSHVVSLCGPRRVSIVKNLAVAAFIAVIGTSSLLFAQSTSNQGSSATNAAATSRTPAPRISPDGDAKQNRDAVLHAQSVIKAITSRVGEAHTFTGSVSQRVGEVLKKWSDGDIEDANINDVSDDASPVADQIADAQSDIATLLADIRNASRDGTAAAQLLASLSEGATVIANNTPDKAVAGLYVANASRLKTLSSQLQYEVEALSENAELLEQASEKLGMYGGVLAHLRDTTFNAADLIQALKELNQGIVALTEQIEAGVSAKPTAQADGKAVAPGKTPVEATTVG